MKEILERLDRIERLCVIGPKEVFNTPEAALYTKMSMRYFNTQVARKKISSYKPEGKTRYFKKSDLDAYMLRNRVCTSEELQEQAIAYVNAPKKRGGRK